MKDILGVEGEQYSESVQRALVDFGSEKSFARAVRSFEEPYGWPVGRTTLRHQTLQAAKDAASYLDERLQQATGTYEQAGMAPPRVPTMLMGLDGCEIRTGVYMKAVEAGLSDRPAQQLAEVFVIDNRNDSGFAAFTLLNRHPFALHIEVTDIELDEFATTNTQPPQRFDQTAIPKMGRGQE